MVEFKKFKKRIIKAFGFALILSLSFVVLAVPTTNLQAEGGPETLEEARSRQSTLKRQQLEAQTEIDAINVEDEKVSDAFNAASILVERQEKLVADIRQQLNAAHDFSEQAEAQVRAKKEQLRLHKAQAKKVALQGYLAIQDSNDSFLLSSNDLNEGIKKQATLDIISTSVGDFTDELRVLEDEAKVIETIANNALLEVIAKEKLLKNELTILEADTARLTALGIELDKRREILQELLLQYEQENRELDDFIEQLEANAFLATSSKYVWPNPGALGNGFGQRFHPILKYWRKHNGIDIPASTGSPIYAIRDGIVSRSTFARGFGNYVIINHGEGIVSIYAHMSRRLVSVDEKVTAGTEIGKIGSTGLSTGPHLHFEIRLNGVPVDPLEYLPPR